MEVEHVYAYVLFLFLFFFPYQPNCTELPKELRQLADIQKLRREKAVKEYRINEDGLLIRPVVELNDRNPQKDETLWNDRDCLPPGWSSVSNYILQQSGSTSSVNGRKSQTSVKSVGEPQTNLRLAVKIFSAGNLISLLCMWGHKMELFLMQKHQTKIPSLQGQVSRLLKGNADGLSNPNFWLRKMYWDLFFFPWAVLAIDFFF